MTECPGSCIVIGRCPNCDEVVCWGHHYRAPINDYDTTRADMPYTQIFASKCPEPFFLKQRKDTNMDSTQSWILIVEVGIIALAALIGLLRH